MIKFIAAIDSKYGLANEHGIPWNLPADKQHFRELTNGGTIVMGYRTYQEFAEPLPNRRNMVVTNAPDPLRPGFEAITNIDEFLQNTKEDIWIIGGAKLFEQTLQYAQELHLTHIEADFKCTKFFPAFEDAFELKEKSPPQVERGLSFYFATYESN